MFKQEVRYHNLFVPGQMVSKELYFHLYLAQIIELDLEARADNNDPEKGLAWQTENIQTRPGAEIIAYFKKLVSRAYGKREDDEFIQSPDISQRFIGSASYDAFLQQLLTNDKLASQFVNGIMPPELLEEANKAIKDGTIPDDSRSAANALLEQEKARLSGLKTPYMPDGKTLVAWWNREPNTKELSEMPQGYMLEVFARKSSGWTPPV